MTQVDFHSNIRDWLTYACRLLRKAYYNKKSVVVLSELERLRILDHKLWTFSSLDFIPHCNINSSYAKDTPIVLTTDIEIKSPQHYGILLNLSSSIPMNFSSFDHLIEVVKDDQDELASGRRRYRFYRSLGYTPNNYSDR